MRCRLPGLSAGVAARAVVVLTAVLAAVGCSGRVESVDGEALSPITSASQPLAPGTTSEGGGDRSSSPSSVEPPRDQAQISGPEPAWVVVAHATVALIEPRVAPSAQAPVIAALTNPTPAGGPLAFQAVAVPAIDPEAEDLLSADWIEVQLPVRPNGTTGWVRREEISLSGNPYRVEIDTAAHQLRVMRDNDLMVETTVGIGTGATPTPLGRFYIIELLQPAEGPDGPYGPYAFGLSGFSETLTSFAGGDGVIGIHGTNRPDALGTDVSHGCVRVANDVIESLAGLLPLGTPVLIT